MRSIEDVNTVLRHIGKKGRATTAEVEKREKSIRELTGKRAAKDTTKAAQKAIDDSAEAGGSGKNRKRTRKNRCSYCQLEGHTYTYRGIITCPLAKQHDAKQIGKEAA